MLDRLEWLIALLGILICIVLAPPAAIYWLVTGEPAQALLAVAVFVAGLFGFRAMLRRRRV